MIRVLNFSTLGTVIYSTNHVSGARNGPTYLWEKWK